jgi:hypothetical protein
MGWSHRGNTLHKYQHYYADDSFETILQADGLLLTPMGSSPKKNKKDLLSPSSALIVTNLTRQRLNSALNVDTYSATMHTMKQSKRRKSSKGS